jgi:hypothetical protein
VDLIVRLCARRANNRHNDANGKQWSDCLPIQ